MLRREITEEVREISSQEAERLTKALRNRYVTLIRPDRNEERNILVCEFKYQPDQSNFLQLKTGKGFKFVSCGTKFKYYN